LRSWKYNRKLRHQRQGKKDHSVVTLSLYLEDLFPAERILFWRRGSCTRFIFIILLSCFSHTLSTLRNKETIWKFLWNNRGKSRYWKN
jgi:hypothetical protein